MCPGDRRATRGSLLVRRGRRVPRAGLPAQRVHEGDRARGRLPRRRPRTRVGHAGPRRRLRTGASLPRAGPTRRRRRRCRPQPGVRPARPRRRGRRRAVGHLRGARRPGARPPGRVRRRHLPVPGRLRPAGRTRRDRGVRPDRGRPPPGRAPRGQRLLGRLRRPPPGGGGGVRRGDGGAARGGDGAWARGRRSRVRALDHLLHRPGARAARARPPGCTTSRSTGSRRAGTGDRPRRSITTSCCSSRAP